MRRLAFRPSGRQKSYRAALCAFAFASTAAAVPARAEDGGSHLLDSALEMMNLKTEPGPMPDFVQQSRHDLSKDSYMPAGTKAANRELKAKTPAEVKALTAELDAAHAAQVAGKRPAPPSVQAGGAAKPGKPRPPAHKTKQATNH